MRSRPQISSTILVAGIFLLMPIFASANLCDGVLNGGSGGKLLSTMEAKAVITGVLSRLRDFSPVAPLRPPEFDEMSVTLVGSTKRVSNSEDRNQSALHLRELRDHEIDQALDFASAQYQLSLLPMANEKITFKNVNLHWQTLAVVTLIELVAAMNGHLGGAATAFAVIPGIPALGIGALMLRAPNPSVLSNSYVSHLLYQMGQAMKVNEVRHIAIHRPSESEPKWKTEDERLVPALREELSQGLRYLDSVTGLDLIFEKTSWINLKVTVILVRKEKPKDPSPESKSVP